MQSTDLLVRPKRHLWESPVAYVFRVASLNRTHYGTLARHALANHSLAGHPLHEIWQIADYANLARENLRLSILCKADRPPRMVCPACVREGQPDSLYGERYRYLEYCLRHGCKPLRECPACGIALRYGSGSYGHCECGFELATAHADAGSPEVLRLYRAIAANMPLEMVPTMQELECRDIHEMNARLQSTWRLLWDEQLHPWNVPETPEVSAILPEFGMRWRAVSCLLGFAEHRLGRWVTQIGCWWRHGRYRPKVGSRPGSAGPPIDLILWRYLRELVKQAVKSGCSGPPVAGTGSLNACVGAGFQCKSRRTGIRGDGLPAPFRRMIGPCTKPFERQPMAVVVSSGCRPAGNPTGRSQSVADFDRQAPGGARKVIELVAIGALQPIELLHPLAWRFAAGDVDDLLRQAFNIQVLRVGRPTGTRSSFDGPHAWLLAPGMTMGGVFAALSFGLLQPLSRPTHSNVWATSFVNPEGMCFDTWAQQAMHDAVLPSLEGRVREAALLAQSFLGGSKALHTNELELFCGMPPLPFSGSEPVALLPYPPTPLDTGIPKNIAWRQGFLYDSALLAAVVKNPQEELVMS